LKAVKSKSRHFPSDTDDSVEDDVQGQRSFDDTFVPSNSADAEDDHVLKGVYDEPSNQRSKESGLNIADCNMTSPGAKSNSSSNQFD
jgi:hypothetical protein